MKKLKVGIAGFGIVGRRRKDCIVRSEYAEVVAVCDKSYTSSGKTDDGINFFPTYSKQYPYPEYVILLCFPSFSTTINVSL